MSDCKHICLNPGTDVFDAHAQDKGAKTPFVILIMRSLSKSFVQEDPQIVH